MADYYAILTNTGKALEAAAIANGTKITLAKFVVGDGNGQAQIPDPVRTALVHEVYRNSISDLTVSTDQPNQIIAQLVMPANVGGFTVREIGLLTDKGELYAIANCATFDKPVNGVSITMQFRLAVSETDNVTLNVATGEGLFLRQDANLSDVKDKQKARQNLQLGTSATKDIGVASGNVMQVGAFGLGGVGVQITDADACDKNGFYSLKAGAHTGSPGGAASWEMLCIKYDSASAKQLFWQAGSATTKTWVRYRISPSGGWGPFQYYYSTENKPTAGDVDAYSKQESDGRFLSKTGGDYTGALKARGNGSNSNGEVRSPNGIFFPYADDGIRAEVYGVDVVGDHFEYRIVIVKNGVGTQYFSFRDDGRLSLPGGVNSPGNITAWDFRANGGVYDGGERVYSRKNPPSTANISQSGWHRDNVTGMITQWGIVSRTGGTTRVWFPNAFPNACVNVQLTLRNSNSDGSTFNVFANVEDGQGFNYVSGNNEVQAFWMAVGY